MSLAVVMLLALNAHAEPAQPQPTVKPADHRGQLNKPLRAAAECPAPAQPAQLGAEGRKTLESVERALIDSLQRLQQATTGDRKKREQEIKTTQETLDRLQSLLRGEKTADEIVVDAEHEQHDKALKRASNVFQSEKQKRGWPRFGRDDFDTLDGLLHDLERQFELRRDFEKENPISEATSRKRLEAIQADLKALKSTQATYDKTPASVYDDQELKTLQKRLLSEEIHLLERQIRYLTAKPEKK